jgi:hypothetical protein
MQRAQSLSPVAAFLAKLRTAGYSPTARSLPNSKLRSQLGEMLI